MPSRLQPRVIQAATTCSPGCNHRKSRLQPYAPHCEQAAELEAGCELVVATPGRLLDFLGIYGSKGQGGPAAGESAPSKHAPATSLAHCTLLVLDEADAMLELGHEQAFAYA